MQPADQSQNPSTRLFHKPRFWVLFILSIPVFVFAIWRTHLALEVSGKLDKVKAAGLPTSGPELNSYYPAVAPEQNAALVLSQAFALVQNYSDKRSNEIQKIKLTRSEPLSPESTDLLLELVETNQAALNKASEALNLPQSRYPIDFTPGPNTKLPHLAKLKNLAGLYQFRARLANDDRESVDSIVQMLRLAHTLDSEPVLISHLVRIAVIAKAESELEHLLSTHALAEEDLKRIQTHLCSHSTNLLANGLVGERACLIAGYRLSLKEARELNGRGDPDKPPATAPQNVLQGSPFTVIGFSGFLERDLSFFLDCMETNIAYARLPLFEGVQVTNVMAELDLTAHMNHYTLTYMLLPALSRAVVKNAASMARIRAGQVAIAIERFRLANNRIPNTLDELVPQFLPSVPEDPFKGKSLRFKELYKGYVVYSVGPDGADNGGKELHNISAKQTKSEPSDITFIVER